MLRGLRRRRVSRQASGGSGIDTPEQMREALKSLGYSDYRELQEEAISVVLEDQDTLVIAATGASVLWASGIV